MRRTTIERDLRCLADELEQLDARREQIYEERLGLWQAGRAQEPPMTQRELAAPSRVTEGAVTQALRKVRIAANGENP